MNKENLDKRIGIAVGAAIVVALLVAGVWGGIDYIKNRNAIGLSDVSYTCSNLAGRLQWSPISTGCVVDGKQVQCAVLMCYK